MLNAIPRFVIFIQLISVSVLASADSYVFKKIVDTQTLVPDRTYFFSNLDTTPSVDEGNVAFSAGGSVFVYGETGISEIVSPGLVPTGISIKNGNLAVRDSSGIHRQVNGDWSTIASTSTPIPQGAGNFDNFNNQGDPGFDGSDVAFIGNGLIGQQGVYRTTGGATLVRVVDKQTPLPSGNSFLFLNGPRLDSGVVNFGVFGNDITDDGIYTDFGSTPPNSVITRGDNVLMPGGIPAHFLRSVLQSADGGIAAFRSSGEFNVEGIFTKDSAGNYSTVAYTSTPIPGGSGNFRHFYGVSLDQGNLAFVGSNAANDEGIYASFGGALSKVVDDNDSLAGMSGFAHLIIGGDSLSGSDIGFTAWFDDGSQAIFLATRINPGSSIAPNNVGSGLTVNNGDAVNLSGGTLPAGSSTNVSNGGQLVLTDGEVSVSGLLQVNGTVIGDVYLQNDGVISGTGSVQGAVHAADGSVITIGNSPGELSFNDLVFETGTHSYEFEIKDADGEAGSDWDLLTVDGNLDFAAGAIIDIDLTSLDANDVPGVIANFDSEASYSWMLTNAASISGFTNAIFVIDASDFMNPIMGAFTVAQQGNEIKLLYTPSMEVPGDFDADGDVDGRDFLIWQRGESPNPLGSDDLADWQANYAAPAISGINDVLSATVPEPSSAALLGLLTMAMARGRLTRR